MRFYTGVADIGNQLAPSPSFSENYDEARFTSQTLCPAP